MNEPENGFQMKLLMIILMKLGIRLKIILVNLGKSIYFGQDLRTRT